MPQVPAHLAKYAAKFNDADSFNMPSGQQFPRISIGKERFTAVNAEGDETLLGLDSFEMIAVASNRHTSKIHFSGPYIPDSEGAPPDCWSDNGFYPDVRCSSPQSESCALCPHNVWGSARSNLNGKDLKACQDFKKVAVLPLHDEVEGVHQLRISPGALRNWARYVNELRKIGGNCGVVVSPNLVVTKVFWGSKNVMDFKFVDFLDEQLSEFVAGIKEDNEFESWIGLDSQAQSYPMFASQPRSQQQRLSGPPEEAPRDAEYEEKTRRPAERIATEVEERLPQRAPRSKAQDRAPPGRAREEAALTLVRESSSPAPGRAREEAAEIGASQGKPMSAIERARARARATLGQPAT